MPNTRFRRAAVALVLAAAAATPALAQRVIRVVVPFGPGAVQDTIARTFNAELGQALGASVVVENRPGAGGTIGTAQVARTTDNNTLVLAAASHTLAGHLYTKLDYDPIKNFTGVAYIGNSGYVIAAPGNLGVNTLADYIKLLKSKQGQLNYASAGNGSATHLGMAYFLAKSGIEMQHVPMKSTGDAVNEVLAGRVQGVTSALLGVTAFKQDPRIKLLAYTGTQRSKFMPELPTVAESGVQGYKFDTWFGLLAPATMPRAEVDRLNAAVNKVLGEPVVQERLARLGIETGTMPVDGFQQLLKADYEAAGALVKASGARIE
ncbi:MAG TPA: tripartite tricarboxylate transporter substrate-binding protein [Ramlibacter sp.]|jgi:tripartite-type tricarboxylate transporter receptor subunit TctC|uniref:tripartite tricarboxylate transporter substrate-binding protein n=1 Tax=Ramlibacter sp. TaxID=1917967 RepID=UPI002D4D8349|nr:tripartite tricarboxylate transporter substrate-binding protein [Ramlibacter sp.]HZY19804.1 tripartite tricarboxylate transporter substrate-binding protein [Ramlibacter sp.]